MKQCKICGSMAINPGHNDRDNISNLDLCDVCYWKCKYFDLLKTVETDYERKQFTINIETATFN